MQRTICAANIRSVLMSIGLAIMTSHATPVAAASGDIADEFRMYYAQSVMGEPYHGPLDFLRDATAAHATADQVLKAGASRALIVDRRNGYLRIDDGSNTDQILTMALYRKADGNSLLVVGSSNCADACSFAVQFFVVSSDRLQPVAPEFVVPATTPGQFFRPGHPVPKRLASLTPSINYVPARIGTTLTLTPWYGYETEEQMDAATRGAIRNVVLTWDSSQGRFVNAHGGS